MITSVYKHPMSESVPHPFHSMSSIIVGATSIHHKSSTIAALHHHVGNGLLVHLVVVVNVKQVQWGHVPRRTAQINDITVLAQQGGMIISGMR